LPTEAFLIRLKNASSGPFAVSLDNSFFTSSKTRSGSRASPPNIMYAAPAAESNDAEKSLLTSPSAYIFI
jgi:hypothetical protein